MATSAAPLLRLNEPLGGSWLALARACWFGAATLALAVFVLGSVNTYREYSFACIPVERPECQALRVLGLEGLAQQGLAAFALATVSLTAITWMTMGWLVFLRKSRSVAELLMSLGLATGWASGLSANNVGWAYFDEVARRPELTTLALGSTYAIILAAQVSVVVMAYLIPDGRFVSRWFVWLTGAWILHTALNALYRYPFELFQGSAVLGFLNDAFTLFAPLSAVVAVWYRYRFVADGLQKLQLKAILPSAITLSLVYATFSLWTIHVWSGEDPETFTPLRFASHFVQSAIQSVCAAWFALSIGIAILRYNLFGVDLVVSRTLVYGALTLALLTGYLLIVFGIGGVLGAPDSFWLSLLAAALVALLFQPGLEYLTRTVNHLLYGGRDRLPYEVLASLSHQVHRTPEARSLLPSVAQVVACTLKLSYVNIVVDLGPLRHQAEVGEPGLELKRFPLSARGQSLGWPEVSLRPGEVLSGAEHGLRGALAEQIAVVAQSLRLASELQVARQELVTLREEERRRLRRDLHDGLGPALAAQTLIVGSARRLLASDPQQADHLLGHLENEMAGLLDQVRQLVYSLRPPDLDQLGLAGAIRRRVAELTQGTLDVELDLSAGAVAYPAAVEVAAYRIVTEAVSNVVRHAKAKTCRVAVRAAGGELLLEITDDGIGLAHAQHGVGLAAMRERAEELGGAFSVMAGPRGTGTRVQARLPVSEVGTVDPRPPTNEAHRS